MIQLYEGPPQYKGINSFEPRSRGVDGFVSLQRLHAQDGNARNVRRFTKTRELPYTRGSIAQQYDSIRNRSFATDAHISRPAIRFAQPFPPFMFFAHALLGRMGFPYGSPRHPRTRTQNYLAEPCRTTFTRFPVRFKDRGRAGGTAVAGRGGVVCFLTTTQNVVLPTHM